MLGAQSVLVGVREATYFGMVLSAAVTGSCGSVTVGQPAAKIL
ncbi:MAG TPA: hypothetical protein VHW44_26490 [Pseudonocardiaceae bacterium]|nr:hypothetical protein [Pseudonocardiaceae bacterium]